MKKIYTCMVALAAGSFLNAQTLTQSNNTFISGDMFTQWHCDSITTAPGASGANAVWNFSSIAIYSTVANNYTAAALTATGYPAGCINVASSTANQAYFLSSASGLWYYGGVTSIGSISANFTYSSPAIAAVYPMSLSTTSTAVIGGAISVSGVPGTFTGNSATLADGTGTLILPGGAAGTYTNVIRVAVSQTLNANAGFQATVTQTRYDYYTPSIKAPLFSVTNETLVTNIPFQPATTHTAVTINKDYLQGTTPLSIVTNKGSVSDLSVYPNPASSQVNFTTENKAASVIGIYDITGKLVEKQNFNDGNLRLDVSNYNKGLYLYSLLNNAGEVLKTGKLTVN